MRVACILEQKDYAPGDQAPEGYLAWHEWAEIQHKAGLRQVECGRCGLWRYPQELSYKYDRMEAQTRKGELVTVITPVCLTCSERDSTGNLAEHAECPSNNVRKNT